MFTRLDDEGFQAVVPGIRMRTLCFGANTLMCEFRLLHGHILPRHAHPHEQTGYLVSGHIALTIGDETHDVLPGDSWCITGGVEHDAEVLQDSVAIEVFSPAREDYLPDGAAAGRRLREDDAARSSTAQAREMRLAKIGDLQTLLDLMADFYAESGYVLDRAYAGGAFTALLADSRLGRVWLIERGSEVVGHVVVTFVFAMEYGGVIAVVDDFYVRPAFRGAGLGTAALVGVRRACKGLGMRALRVEVGGDNAIAQSVYRRVGFEMVEHQLMTLPLAAPTHVV